MSEPAGRLNPIDAPGTDERTWAAWSWLSTLPGSGLAGLAGVTSAVVVAAHPDDEVLGAGGLISVLAASRARLRLVAVTDGERSHRGRTPPAVLARRRTAETAAALRALGARTAEVIRLRLPDGGLAAREDELTAALAPAGRWFRPVPRPVGPRHASRPRGGRARRATGGPGAFVLLPGLDVALGLPRRSPGALGPGTADPAPAARGQQETRRDQLLRQPDDRPGPRPRARCCLLA